jgi:hypothetical protein
VDSDDIDFYIGENPPSHVPSSATIIQNSLQILPNVALAPIMNCKLINIAKLNESPIFHFEIDGKIYFYGLQKIIADNKIILNCTRSHSKCYVKSSILPSESLKEIIKTLEKPFSKNYYPDNYSLNKYRNASNSTNYTKYVDRSDPKVYDINNYDINSFEIREEHKCTGTEISVYLNYLNSQNKPVEPVLGPKEVQECKLVDISNRRGNPIFHFEINGKIYSYGLRLVRADYKIILHCTRPSSKCYIKSSISPSESLKEIIKIREATNHTKVAKYLDRSDPKFYDINNYDINSFEVRGEHKCAGTEIAVYLKNINSQNKEVIGVKEVKECKLVDISNHFKNPQFHFEINGKPYVYGYRGIKTDYRIVLYCSKVDRENKKVICGNFSSILPSEFLKKNIIKKNNLSKYSKSLKFLDKSDPKVFDISNYDISSFDIGRGHKCLGTELRKNNFLKEKTLID